MRIGNVVQSSRSHHFSAGVQEIPQFQQNSINPHSSFTSYPYSSSLYPESTPTSPSAPLQIPSNTLYGFVHNYLPKPSFFPTSPSYQPSSSYSPSPAYAPSPSYSQSPSYASSSYSPSSSPSSTYSSATSPFSFHSSPFNSFFKQRGPTPYTYEQFGVPTQKHGYPFQRLNTGETLPQSNTLVNLNFGLANEVYRPAARFARNPSQNATSYHWIDYRRSLKYHAPRFLFPIQRSSPHKADIFPFIHAIPSVE